jgi:SAM-dependent methyltransferase
MGRNDSHPNDAQAALWNGSAGDAWVQAQTLLDGMFDPFTERLLARLDSTARPKVLDVGCGTGAASLAIARQLRADADVSGIDISAAMISAARARAERAGLALQFICADAQRHEFPRHRFDRVVSRFGVMFFDAPLQAFARLRHATRAGGELHAIVWRDAAENPFMTTAERAAAPLLHLPPRKPRQPGQFAFADCDYVQHILRDSGWERITIRPLDIVCRFAVSDLPSYVSLLGPVGVALRTQATDAAARSRVLSQVLDAFSPFIHGDEVRFNAACWELLASADSAPM